MRCELCNYCKETGTESTYYSDDADWNVRVDYYPKYGKCLCSECAKEIRFINQMYLIDNLGSSVDDDEPNAMGENPLTLSEVH